MQVRYTPEFQKWFDGLRDRQARMRIAVRIDRIGDGNLGDHKFFDGLGELRFDFGPGYRVYFLQQGEVLILLLCGGDKSSQERDIRRAKLMAREFSDG